MPARTSVKRGRLCPVGLFGWQKPLGYRLRVSPQSKNLVPGRCETSFNSQRCRRPAILRCALPEKGACTEKENRTHLRVVNQLFRSKQSRLLPPFEATLPTGNPSIGRLTWDVWSEHPSCARKHDSDNSQSLCAKSLLCCCPIPSFEGIVRKAMSRIEV